MLKKSIKSILLIASVITAFVLVYQIWFGSYFLPDGSDYLTSGLYNYVVKPVAKLFTGKNDTDFSQNLKRLLKPSRIVLHYSGERRMFKSGSADFEELRELSEEWVSRVMLGELAVKSRDTVDTEAYFSVLKRKSIYVDYGKDCDFRLFSFSICGQPRGKLAEDLNVVNGYVISLHDGILNDISLYIMDQKSGSIYRYIIEADKTELESRLKDSMQQPASGSMPSYSFELNFHKAQEESVSKILFSPLVLMEVMPVGVQAIREQAPAEAAQLLSDGATDAILKVFSIDSRTMRKYTDLNDARVFIENNATLTLYPDGRLEYQTVPGSRGLEIAAETGRNDYDIYAATADAVDFVTELCSLMPQEFFSHLQINTNLVNDSAYQGTYRLAFDYCIDGIPVRYKTDTGYASAIEIELDNGYLISYRQYIRTYERLEETYQLQPMLTAADSLVDRLYDGENPLYITKVAVCYAEEPGVGFEPKWYAVADGTERIME